jgi:hypothetical protein
VTFRLAGSKQALILLPVFVDARGPYSFVLGTGAGSTVISNELADALALPRGENQDVGKETQSASESGRISDSSKVRRNRDTVPAGAW